MVATAKPEVRNRGRRGAAATRFALLVLASAVSCLLVLAACEGEDLTPPEVTILAPAEGDSILGMTIIRARATDNRSVERVEFLVDSARVGIDSTPAGSVFDYNWMPAGLLPGSSHTLRCIAVDPSGNRNTSPAVTVHISAAAGTHHRGTIAANETWTLSASPHIIDANLAIEAFVTVEPGVTIMAADLATIAVGTHGPAGLRAAGRADSAITFTALATSPGPGSWGGIEFRANAVPDSNVLKRCSIRYAGANGKALVWCEAGAPEIDSCDLRSSSGSGVAASGLLGKLANTTIADCAGYPVSLPAGLVSGIGGGNHYSGNQRDAIELTGGTVADSDTWRNYGVPYCITGTITVAGASNPLITIAPGCSLLFGDSTALRIGVAEPGGLRADGTYGRITFAALAASPGPGNWGGIQFWEQTDPARTTLNYCRVENAGTGNSAAITCYSAAVTVTNTRIADNAGIGVYCINSGFTQFENDTITGCADYPLHIAAQHVATIGNGNSFTGNAQDGIQVAGGTITRDAQWQRQDVPYVVTADIEVGSGFVPTLTLESGITCRFGAGTGLAVGRTQPGRLQAIGVPDSITLTAAMALPGSWRGIELCHYASNLTRLERCRILYGGSANHGILFIDSCIPALYRNEIAWSSNYCVYLVNTDIEPDTIRYYNWLHDWAPGYDDIGDEP